MKVEQINVGNILRNFIYVIYSEKSSKAWCIDPYEHKSVIKFLDSKELELEMVLNTHLHFDHTKGNAKLKKKKNCQIWDFATSDRVELEDDFYLDVLKIPGHTKDHIGFILKEGEKQLGFFSGDTIFHNGVGNCSNGGDVETLYHSLQEIKKIVLPESDLYVGHDYGVSNMKFGMKHCELDLKSEISNFKGDPQRVFKFSREIKLNPFFHCTNLSDFTNLRKKRDKW